MPGREIVGGGGAAGGLFANIFVGRAAVVLGRDNCIICEAVALIGLMK